MTRAKRREDFINEGEAFTFSCSELLCRHIVSVCIDCFFVEVYLLTYL